MKVTEVGSKSCRKFLRTCETLQILFTDKCPSVSLISFKKKSGGQYNVFLKSDKQSASLAF